MSRVAIELHRDVCHADGDIFVIELCDQLAHTADGIFVSADDEKRQIFADAAERGVLVEFGKPAEEGLVKTRRHSEIAKLVRKIFFPLRIVAIAPRKRLALRLEFCVICTERQFANEFGGLVLALQSDLSRRNELAQRNRSARLTSAAAKHRADDVSARALNISLREKRAVTVPENYKRQTVLVLDIFRDHYLVLYSVRKAIAFRNRAEFALARRSAVRPMVVTDDNVTQRIEIFRKVRIPADMLRHTVKNLYDCLGRFNIVPNREPQVVPSVALKNELFHLYIPRPHQAKNTRC